MAGLAAAGAAAGTAIMPGIGTAVGGLAGALADTFMGGSGGSAQGPAGTSSAAVAVYGSGLNGDNWNVNFMGSPVNTSSAYKPFSATGPTASTAGEGGAIVPPGAGSAGGLNMGASYYGIPLWGWLAAGGLILWKASKSRK